jgi:hypothetical protein
MDEFEKRFRKWLEIERSKPKPSSAEVPNPYNVPIHDQGNKNNCSTHAFASSMEHILSEMFNELTLIDVDDLWEKQKRFGTATEADGDFVDGPMIIAKRFGVKFKTASGRKGTYFFDGRVIWA